MKDYSLLSDSDYTYDYPSSDSVTAKDKPGRTWTISFSSLRGVMTSTDPLGRKTVSKYYRQLGLIYDFKLRQIKDADGHVVVENKYNKEGNLIWTRNMLGTVTRFEINPQGKIANVIRAYKKGEPETVAAMEYDKQGRLIRLADAMNQRQEWRYNQAGDVAETIDKEGHRYLFNYDARGFLLSYADAAGNMWKIDYDIHGRPARMTSPNGVQIGYKSDKGGRVTEIERLLPGVNEKAVALMKRAYDAAGRPAGVTDALGRITKFEYDEQGRLAAAVNPLGVATRHEYDDANRLQGFWMEGGDGKVRGKTTLAYTALNQLKKQVDALGNELSWEFDAHSRPVCKNMGDQKIRWTYDKFGRATTVDYDGNNEVNYKYDNAGRTVRVSTPTTSADYRYDKLGRLIETIRCSGTETNVLHYSYTPMGRKAAVEWQRTAASGVTKGRTDYLYDKAGALAEIRADGKTMATYSYDKLGNLREKQLADGMQVLYRHDILGRITDMIVKSASGKTLTQVAYTWDNADQLMSRNWDGKAQNYVYDKAGQLTGVTSGGLPGESYAYDPAGNMIEKAIGGEKTAMTYDPANRLTMATGKQETRYAYDPAGRIKEEISGGRETEYRYGVFGKVSQVLEPDVKRTDYNYWPDGQMASKESFAFGKENTKTESYLWDGLALMARGDEKFTVEPHISGGVPVMASDKESAAVLISDFLGTTLGVVKGEDFTPTPLTAFGESSGSASKENSAFSILHSSLFFTGKPYDSDLKAYTFLFRNYRPELGRWTATDPAGFPDGVNNWLYCNNMLMNTVDPLGLTIAPMFRFWEINMKVKSGVVLTPTQQQNFQAMIAYAQAVLSRMNSSSDAYQLNAGAISIDSMLNASYDSSTIDMSQFAANTIYIVSNSNCSGRHRLMPPANKQ